MATSTETTANYDKERFQLGYRNQIYSFCLEDTSERCYRDISEYLCVNGWNKVQNRKRSKVEKKRFPLRELPLFLWTINEKDMNFDDLLGFQVCNHFEGMANALTTKMGFCDSLREMLWTGDDMLDISPRCSTNINFL